MSNVINLVQWTRENSDKLTVCAQNHASNIRFNERQERLLNPVKSEVQAASVEPTKNKTRKA